jgi:hypothetical protein
LGRDLFYIEVSKMNCLEVHFRNFRSPAMVRRRACGGRLQGADILRVSFDRRRPPDAVRVEVGHWRRIFALRRELV